MTQTPVLEAWLTFTKVSGLKRPKNHQEYLDLVELANQVADHLDEDPSYYSLFDLITEYIGDWERDHEELIPDAPPHEMLNYYMELKGLKQSDLLHIIDQGNLSKILSGKRKIGAKLAKRFGEFFGVNPGVFL